MPSITGDTELDKLMKQLGPEESARIMDSVLAELHPRQTPPASFTREPTDEDLAKRPEAALPWTEAGAAAMRIRAREQDRKQAELARSITPYPDISAGDWPPVPGPTEEAKLAAWKAAPAMVNVPGRPRAPEEQPIPWTVPQPPSPLRMAEMTLGLPDIEGMRGGPGSTIGSRMAAAFIPQVLQHPGMKALGNLFGLVPGTAQELGLALAGKESHPARPLEEYVKSFGQKTGDTTAARFKDAVKDLGISTGAADLVTDATFFSGSLVGPGKMLSVLGKLVKTGKAAQIIRATAEMSAPERQAALMEQFQRLTDETERFRAAAMRPGVQAAEEAASRWETLAPPEPEALGPENLFAPTPMPEPASRAAERRLDLLPRQPTPVEPRYAFPPTVEKPPRESPAIPEGPRPALEPSEPVELPPPGWPSVSRHGFALPRGPLITPPPRPPIAETVFMPKPKASPGAAIEEKMASALAPGDVFTFEGEKYTVSAGKEPGKLKVKDGIEGIFGPEDRIPMDADSHVPSGKSNLAAMIGESEAEARTAVGEEVEEAGFSAMEEARGIVGKIRPDGLRSGLSAGEMAKVERLLRVGRKGDASTIARSLSPYFDPALVVRKGGKVVSIKGLEEYLNAVPSSMRAAASTANSADQAAEQLFRAEKIPSADIDEMGDYLGKLHAQAPAAGKAFMAEAVAEAPPVVGKATTRGPIRSLGDLRRDIENTVKIPVETMTERERAALEEGVRGFYDIRAERVATRGRNDIAAISHELGHHVENALFPSKEPGVLTGEAFAEFKPYLESLGGKLVAGPSESAASNGLAEFVRHYVMDPETIAADPMGERFLHHFEGEVAARNPEALDLLARLRAGYGAIRTATPQARIAADIAYRTPGRPRKLIDAIAEAAHNAYSRYQESLSKIERAERELRGPGWIERNPEKSVAKLADFARYAGNHNYHWMKSGPIDFLTNRPVSGVKGLEEIYDMARSHPELDQYATAKRDIELADRGIVPEGTHSLADSQSFAAQIEGDAPKTVAAYAELQKYNRALLKYVYDSGRLTPEAYAAIQARNHFYIPFRRLFEEIEGGRATATAKTLHEIEGSAREIVNPVGTLAENTFSAIRAGDEARIARALYRLTKETKGFGKYVLVDAETDDLSKALEIGEEAKDSDYVRVKMNNLNGAERDLPRQAVLRVSRDIHDALQGVQDPVRVWEWLEKSNAIVRALTVEHAPAAIWLGIRDIGTTRMLSTAQRGLRIVDPIVNYAKGLFGSFAEGKALDEALLSRGLMEGYRSEEGIGNVDRLMRSLQANKKSNWDRFTKAVSEAVGPAFSRKLERTPRIGEHEAMLAQAGKPPEALTLGERMKMGEAARNVAVAYSRTGSSRWLNAWDRINMFQKARRQGWDLEARTLGKHPLRSAAVLTSGVVVPTVIHWLMTHDNKRYKAMPGYQKALAWWFYPSGENGPAIPVPIPPGIATLVKVATEYGLNAAFDKDPAQGEAFANRVLSEMGQLVVPSNAVIRGGLEVTTGRSSDDWTQNVVPSGLEHMHPSQQALPYTSETARGISATVGKIPGIGGAMERRLNPIQTDRLLRILGAPPGQEIKKAADWLFQRKGEPAQRWYERAPFLGSRMARPSYQNTEMVSIFEDRWQKYASILASANKDEQFRLAHKDEVAMAERLKDFANVLAENRLAARKIDMAPTLNPETKRRRLAEISLESDRVARRALTTMDRIKK